MKSLLFPISACLVSLQLLSGCATTDAALMTLGGNGSFKTGVVAWQTRLQLDDVTGYGGYAFSVPAFQQALQQTLINVGYISPSRQGTLHLKVQLLEVLSAPFANERSGILRMRYVLNGEAVDSLLLDEKVDTICFSSQKVRPDEKSVMEECGRENIRTFLRKLELKGLTTQRA